MGHSSHYAMKDCGQAKTSLFVQTAAIGLWLSQHQSSLCMRAGRKGKLACSSCDECLIAYIFHFYSFGLPQVQKVVAPLLADVG